MNKATKITALVLAATAWGVGAYTTRDVDSDTGARVTDPEVRVTDHATVHPTPEPTWCRWVLYTDMGFDPTVPGFDATDGDTVCWNKVPPHAGAVDTRLWDLIPGDIADALAEGAEEDATTRDWESCRSDDYLVVCADGLVSKL